MQVYEVIGPTLRRVGATVVFGLMGDGNLRFVSQFRDAGLRFYGTRHESCAVAMADGYARAGGQVGVCTVTQGPGLTNALTALRTASTARTPLVILAGDTPRAASRHIQDVDQQTLFELAGAGVEPLHSADAISGAIVRAFARATDESRPIGISVPTDLQDQFSVDSLVDGMTTARGSGSPAPSADVRRAIELIAESKRPIILAGRGAVSAAARDDLEQLADRVGGLLTTTLLAKDLFTNCLYSAGIAGGFSSRLTADLLREADLILAFGASLNYWTTRNDTLFAPSARLICCDIDAGAPALLHADCALVGDAAATARELLALIEDSDVRTSEWRRPGLANDLAAQRVDHAFEDKATDGTVDPRSLCIRLDELIPQERLLAVDGGHFTGFPCMYMSVPDPTALLFGVTFGSIGLGVALALGGAIGRPDRLAVAVVGDGGLTMNIGDLETAARYGIPALIVVINDSAYGAELHHLTLLGLDADEATFPDLDLAAVARTLGLDACTVTDIDQLAQLSQWLDDPQGPLLLDCKTTRAVRAEWLDEAVLPRATRST